MEKTSKTIMQKEAASSSRPTGEKPVVEPRLEEFSPGIFIDAAVSWMPGAVHHLENWAKSLVSTSTYAERACCNFSKGRCEARTHGLRKDVAMRPPSGDEEALLPISKPAMVIKRKRALDSEGQKHKKRTARKPKGNVIPLTMESVQRLRDDKEEEEEGEGDSGMVARAQASTYTQKTSDPVEVDFAPSRFDKVEGETPAQVLEPRGTEDTLPQGEETIEEEVDIDTETGLEASMLHHEVFLRSRGELRRYDAEIQRLTEEGDAFKLLSKKREGEAKGLRAGLEVARREQDNLSDFVPQVQQKLDVIRQLRVEVDAVKAEDEEWKKNMDCLASEKEAARTQLALAENQLRSLKEKSLVQAKKIEEFQYRLGSTTSDRERLATELAAAKSEVEIDTANADAMVAVYRSDAEAAQVRAKEVVEAAQARAN
ncbi:uncharacterized protein [Nicotiana tomentosiformis]|uniref:uncharacterized protein n=1 Tax=Nicotiana tomentosiformis TaxID=4098 RepID=UPI00388CBCAE